jgi:hypothetical protein
VAARRADPVAAKRLARRARAKAEEKAGKLRAAAAGKRSDVRKLG